MVKKKAGKYKYVTLDSGRRIRLKKGQRIPYEYSDYRGMGLGF